MDTSSELQTFKRIWELSKDSPYMAKMDNADLTFAGDNAVCGDWLEISLKLSPTPPVARGGAWGGGSDLASFNKRKINEARFLHKGCAVSAVSASVLLEYGEGKTLQALLKLKPEDQLKLFGAPVSPARMKCALLPLEILKLKAKPAISQKVAKKKKMTRSGRS